jgi:hypothetical protein
VRGGGGTTFVGLKGRQLQRRTLTPPSHRSTRREYSKAIFGEHFDLSHVSGIDPDVVPQSASLDCHSRGTHSQYFPYHAVDERNPPS